MKNYSKYDLSNKITLLVLLTNGIPKKVNAKPVSSKNVTVTDYKMPYYPWSAKGLMSDWSYTRLDNNFWNNTVYTQNIDYLVAMQLVAQLYNRNIPDAAIDKAYVKDYDFKNIAITGHIIAYNHKSGNTCVISNINVIGLKDDLLDFKLDVYSGGDKMFNQLLINELHLILKHQIGEYTYPIEALKNLWVTQVLKYNIHANQSKSHKKEDPFHIKVPAVAKKLFLQLLVGSSQINGKNSEIPKVLNITYQDMVSFYNEIQAGHLTDKTRKVQDWIFKGNSSNATRSRGYKKHQEAKLNNLLAMLQMRSNYDNVMNGIKEVDMNSPFVAKLNHQFRKNRDYKHYGFKLANVYKLDYPQQQIPGKYKFVGLHGTNSYSVPSILFSSLCNGQELNQLNRKYGETTKHANTGQAFGTGIYFAALHDSKPSHCHNGIRKTCGITKSLNYSNSHHDKYKTVFIATSTYNNPTYAKSYWDNIGHHDWLFSKNVGGSEGLSEAVTKSSKQIHLDYLCVFKKK